MYPIMLDITDKKIIVIGGGRIALRKTRSLLQAGGRVTVIAPRLEEGFKTLTNVSFISEKYHSEQLKEAQLIFACTDSKSVNQQIVADAASWQWVNDCSQKENSDFYNMAVLQHETGVVAFSSHGQSPTETKRLKQEIEETLKRQIK